MTQKLKLISYIITVVLLISIILGTGILFAINYFKTPQATIEGQSLSTNLFNTDGTVNKNAAIDLLNAVGYDGKTNLVGYKAHQLISHINTPEFNSDASLILPMGYFSGNSGESLYWQATYLYNNYLTLWMVKGYASSTWNSSTTNVSYNSYASSTIQSYLTNTFWPLLTQNSSNLQSLFATPYTVGYQFLTNSNSNDTSYWYSENSSNQNVYYSNFNNMSLALGQSCYVWLPSFGEVFNNTSSSFINDDLNYTGLWGLNNKDRCYITPNYDGTTQSGFLNTPACWLRSGYGSESENAIKVTSSGAAANSTTSGSYSVRPAIHLSLKALADAIGYNVTANIASDSLDMLQLNKSSINFDYNTSSCDSFIYTANSNYYVDQITIGSIVITNISDNIPTSFTPSINFDYRVYRSGNSVVIELRNVNSDLNVEGHASAVLNIVTGSGITINSISRSSYYSTTATFTATISTSGLKIMKAGTEWVFLNGDNGNGFIGNNFFEYTISNSILTLNLYDLENGPIRFLIRGDAELLNYSVTGGAASVRTLADNSNYRNIVVIPQENFYVNSIIIDNVAFNIEFYKGEFYGAGNAYSLSYSVKDTNNYLNLIIIGQYDDSEIMFNLSNIKPNYQVPISGSASVTGTLVTATNGGEARMVGFDYDETTDNETITFIAVNYTGYTFSGWSVDGEILDGYGMSANIPYALVRDKIVTAVFTPISNNNTNDSTDNGYGEFV